MSETIRPISVRDFMSKYIEDEKFFDYLPEFSFIKPVSQKAKEKNCTCGLGPEIARVTEMYNDFVESISPELQIKVKAVFGTEKLCFAIQKADDYSVKCL